MYQGSFTASVGTSSSGTPSVTSSTTGVCTLTGFTVNFVNVGTCTLTAHVASDTSYLAANGIAQSFTVGRWHARPRSCQHPDQRHRVRHLVAAVSTTGDGGTSVASISTAVCTVGADGHTVTFVGFGDCTLTASVAQDTHFFGARGATSVPGGPAARVFWLLLRRRHLLVWCGGLLRLHGEHLSAATCIVGITPQPVEPATGSSPPMVASSASVRPPITGPFPSGCPGRFRPAQQSQCSDCGHGALRSGHGDSMIASDGGVFAFGDARFAGSCPGIGGCSGKAISVMPDSTGNGYWLVTNVGALYAFGDAPSPAPRPVDGAGRYAVAMPDWRGYWLLYANGVVDSFGDATSFGAPLGYVNGFNPATSIFPTADGRGYWVASGRGDVFAYGNAPYLGSEAAAGLNGEIIAAFRF